MTKTGKMAYPEILEKISENIRLVRRERTDMYAKAVEDIYHGYSVLAPGVEYKGPDVAINHMCRICSGISYVRPKTHLGPRTRCHVCRSTPASILEYKKFAAQLSESWMGKYELAQVPAKFDGSTVRATMFRCTDCGAQHYTTPLKIMSPEYACLGCLSIGKRTPIKKHYQKHLNGMYKNSIRLRSSYSKKNSMRHICSEGHIFNATMQEMLAGKGCEKCGTSKFLQIVDFSYRNRKFPVRSQLEKQALLYMLERIPEFGTVQTRYNYPMPIVYKNHVAAFYLRRQKALIDVVKRSKLKSVSYRIDEMFRLTKEQDLDYGVIIIDGPEESGIWNLEMWEENVKRRKEIERRREIKIKMDPHATQSGKKK